MLCGAMPTDTLAERLRCQAAQLMGLSCVCSNPTGLVCDDPAAKPAWRPKTKQRGTATSQGSQRRKPAMAPASTRLCPARGAGDGLGEDFKEPHEVVGCHSHASRWPRTRLCGFMPLSVSQVHAQITALSFLDLKSSGQAMHSTGLWRNGSASDSRSEG